MKTTGIIRKIDHLGRVVTPIEIRRKLGWENNDPIEIFIEDDKVIFRKYSQGCCKCNDMNTVDFLGKKICKECLKKEAYKYL